MSVGGPVFTVFGAGLSGALLAARLGRAGVRVDLYERRPDPRVRGAERGRSINLALSTRGLEALAGVGLRDEALKIAIPMRGRMMHSPTGALTHQPYSPSGLDAINSISRGGLNALLLDAAERTPGVRIFFGQRCQNVDFAAREAEVLDVAGGGTRRVGYDVVIGADGAFSAVRGAMQRLDRFDFEQSYLTHAYKELSIPPGHDRAGGAAMDRHALHIWPRRSYMMIALPNLDGSWTCTLFAPFDGPDGIGGLSSDADIRAYFERRFPDAVPMMPTLAEDFRANPAASLVTMRCRPWRVGGEAALVGDAAHAVVPFYGQGMNASFEDCAALAECVEASRGDLASAFAAYEDRRRPNTDALARLALDNFVEMRDLVGDPAFLRRKAREQRLARWFPRWYVPLYSMVSFSTIPYAEAVERARRQDERVRLIVGLLAAVALPAAGLGLVFLLRALFVRGAG